MASLARYLTKRAVDRGILIFVVVTIQFILVRVIPTYVLGIDPSQFLISADSTPEQIALLRKEFGLDDPIFPFQYAKYVLTLFIGNFGNSFITKRPIIDEIQARLPNTLILQGLSLVIITIAGLLIGLHSASKRGKRADSTVIQLSIFSYVMPSYLMGIILLMGLAWYPNVAFGVKLFPISGTRTPLLDGGIITSTLDYLWHLALPLSAVVLSGFGSFAYFTRNLAVSELGQDYVLTDRAKGLPPSRIMRRHVLKSVAAPVITSVALSVRGVVGGLIITEAVFSWFGMGQYIFSSLQALDYPAVQAAFFMIAILVAVSLFFADVVISIIDPRVRLR